MKINSDFMWSIYLILIAAIFFYFGNVLAVSETEEKFSRVLDENTEKLKLLEKQNLELSDKLTSKGILSYPQANILSTENDTITTILITLNGSTPLEDLKVNRSYIYNYSKVEHKDLPQMEVHKKTTFLGTLKTHTPAGFEIKMKEEEVAIDLVYQTGENTWNQHMRIKRDSNNELMAFWILTNKNNEVIDKHVDKGFPAEDDGSILLYKNKSVFYSDIKMNSSFSL